MLPSKPIPQTVAHRQYATTPEAYDASTLETVTLPNFYICDCMQEIQELKIDRLVECAACSKWFHCSKLFYRPIGVVKWKCARPLQNVEKERMVKGWHLHIQHR